MPAEVAHGERLAPGSVEPILRPGEVRRLPVGLEADRLIELGRRDDRRAVLAHGGQVGRDRLALLEVAGRVDEDTWQVAGDRGLEADVQVRGHRDGDEHHHGAHRHLHPPADGVQALGEPPAAEQQQVEDDRGADRVREGDGEAPGREVLRRRDDDHTGEDRPRARGVDQAEAGADDQSRAEAVSSESGRPGRQAACERLDPVADRRDQQREPEDEEDGDRQVAREPIRQPEGVDHVDQRHRGEGEGESKPGDDPERPAPVAGDASRKDRGQDRQHARGQRRARPGDEREEHQQCHLGPDSEIC